MMKAALKEKNGWALCCRILLGCGVSYYICSLVHVLFLIFIYSSITQQKTKGLLASKN